MKRIISLIIALCLVLGSFSYAFAAATQWDTSDSQHLTGIYNSLVSTTVNGVLNAILQIESDLATYMPLKSDVKTISTTLGQIWSALSFAVDGQYISVFVARIMTAVESLDTDLTTVVNKLTSIDNKTGDLSGSKYVTMMRYQNGQLTFETRQMSIFDSINTLHNYGLLPFAQMILAENNQNNLGYDSTQLIVSPRTLTSTSYTPSSAIDGIYAWFKSINESAARLAFVLANDQEIAARQKAEANQTAVVNNFIDSSGSGSVGVSDFGSLSDASGAMKTNFNTGQSASGVFNVFDDQHFGYLSQDSANSLDTSGSNTRLLKASGSDYPTPTLDRYYEELNKILEVNTND